MVEYLLGHPLEWKFSCLALAIIAGTLKSLAEATPAQIGHTYLWGLYDAIHGGPDHTGVELYHTHTPVSECTRRDMSWWQTILTSDMSHPACPCVLESSFPPMGMAVKLVTVEQSTSLSLVWEPGWANGRHTFSPTVPIGKSLRLYCSPFNTSPATIPKMCGGSPCFTSLITQ